MTLIRSCRTCLQLIEKKPVLISKAIYEFLENVLHLTRTPRKHLKIGLPQNLCFICYRKIIELQRFYEILCETECYLWSEIVAIETAPAEILTETVTSDSTQINTNKIFSINDNNRSTNTNCSKEIIEYEYIQDRNEDVLLKFVPSTEDDVHSYKDELIVLGSYSDSVDKEESPGVKETDVEDQNDLSNNVELIRKFFDCRFCDERFFKISELRGHEHVHSEARPHICDICGKAFRQKNVLVTHMTLHTGKKVACELCGKKFARRSQLILHNRMHNDEKPFICDYPGCEASYRQRQYLWAHKEIHTGVRKYACLKCPKSFFNRMQMLAHEDRVHNHCFMCNLCSEKFRKSSMISEHMTTVHNILVKDIKQLKKSLS